MHGGSCFGWSFLGKQLSTTKNKNLILIHISNKQKTLAILEELLLYPDKDNHFKHFDLGFTENVLQGLQT